MISNKRLEEQGAEIGDVVMFLSGSEYEIKVEDTPLYCMESKDIVATIDETLLPIIEVVK